MTLFRITLLIMTVIIIGFGIAIARTSGLDFLTPFAAPILASEWQGHFNVDFSFYLMLSGIWLAWRHGFTPLSILLGCFAPILGMSFLAPYLLVMIARGAKTPEQLLLGVHAKR